MGEQEKRQHDSVVSFGSYRLDMGNVQLWRGSQEVKLTGKAFAVLRYLVEHPGQLATKDDLFAAAWSESVISESTLVSCIQELRQALRDDAKKPRYIETVHRRGYRFIGKVVNNQEAIIRRKDGEADRQGVDSVMPAQAGSQEAQVQATSDPPWIPAFAGMTPPPIPPQNHNPSAQLAHSLDTPAPTPQRSWSVRSLVVMGFVLLVGVVIAVHYLPLPLPSIQHPIPNTQSLPLPDKPSIIVLPFTNLSGDPTQDYFSDGITADITSTLSRLSKLLVISRTSAFTYKGKPTKVQDISKEMGVRYVLEGSIRKTDDQLRIAVELIDATIDHPLWAEQYDRPLKNLFVVQDEIVHRIVTTLNLQLTVREQGFIVRRHTNNLEAYDVFLRGMELHLHFTKETTAQARQMFEKVLTLDPQDAEAYVMLAFTYHNDWILRWSSDSQTLERALALVQQAVAIDDSLPDAHSLLGMIYTLKRQYDQAIAEGEQAIALDPNEGDSYGMQAQTLVYAGRGEQAIQMAQRAMRLNPRYPVWYSFELGWAYRVTGQYAESVAALQEAIRQNPKYLPAHLQLAFTYLMQWAFQESMDEQILDQALAEVQRSLTFSDALPSGHEFLGQIYLWQKQYERAIAEMEQSIILDPNEARSYAVLAETLSRVGRSEEAVRMVEQALRRKPAPMYSHLSSVGLAYYLAGRPEEATAPLKQFLGHYPNILGPHLTLAAAYSELGKDAEARVEATEVLRINPKFSLEVHKERVPIKDPALLERHIAALRKAGLR